MTRNPAWWGNFHIPKGTQTRWRIGPMTMWIERLAYEWRVARELVDVANNARVEIEPEAAYVDLLQRGDLSRFGVDIGLDRIHIKPRLADRPVVCSPERAVFIPARQSVTVYVGSPLWAQLAVGERGDVVLHEFPIHRPSDTWFGPSTMDGELCYASRTAARLRLDEVSALPHRALTAVSIENHADTPLPLEKLKLPVQYLSLFVDGAGYLWTEDIELVRFETEDLAPLALGKGPPRVAPGAPRLSRPRLAVSGNLFVRAFETLFSRRAETMS
jgi:hypothetical protein